MKNERPDLSVTIARLVRSATPITPLEMPSIRLGRWAITSTALALLSVVIFGVRADVAAQAVNGIPLITHNLGDATGDFLQAIADALKSRFQGVVVLGGGAADKVCLVASVSPEFTSRVQAGRIIQQIAPIVGGKGGGRPDSARGGGRDASRLDEALAKVRTLW